MLDTVQPEKQNKTNDLKQQGKEKTYKKKITLDPVQAEQQNKTNDPKQKRNRKHTGGRLCGTQCNQSSRTKQMTQNNKEKGKYSCIK